MDLYGTEPNQYFKEKIGQLNPGRILIPGEGEGRQAIYAAQNGWQVTAFDMSKVGQQHAMQKAESLALPLNYQVSKAEEFNFEKRTYDCAALIYFHLPPAIRPNIHQKIASSVKRGRYLILEGFHPKQLALSSGGPKNDEMLYTVEMLSKDFEGWEYLEKMEGEILLQEGSGHAGPAFVSRLLARKKD